MNRIIGKDGLPRLYFRKRGFPSIPLKSPWGSASLEAEVEALIAHKAAPALPGTMRLVVRAYELESADFRALRASTKREYRYILREFEEDFGALPVSAFQAERIHQLRDVWSRRGHRAANIRLQLLKNVLRKVIVAGLIPGPDPFAHVRLVRRPADAGEPHELWPEEVFQTIVQAAISQRRFGLARAVILARYTGVRRGDLIRLTEANRANGRVSFRSGKRRVLVDIQEDPQLTHWLAQTPSAPERAGHSRHLVYGLRAPNYTEDGLALELRKLVARLAKAGHLPGANYNLHGLRHTRGVELALGGCTDAQGAAQMGHSSPSSFAQYRRQADRRRMADAAADQLAAFRKAGGGA